MDATAISKVISDLGGQAAVAEAIGTKRSTVSMWVTRGKIPLRFCPQFCELTGKPLHEVRPDVFTAPEPVE